MMTNTYLKLNLQLFAEGGAGGTAGAPAGNGEGSAAPSAGNTGRNALAKVEYGKDLSQGSAAKAEPETSTTASTQEARVAEFDRLIRGDYKDLYDQRVQQIINQRFKDNKALETKAATADSLSPVLDILSRKYGVDASDTDSLIKAMEADDSYFEDEAAEKGLTVSQLKEMRRLEKENADFKRAAQQKAQREQDQQRYAAWAQQAEATKQYYQDFDLRNEVQNPQTGDRFIRLLNSGVDVRTAYEVIHKDELIGGAMQYTARQVQQQTINDIKARGMRPDENGASGAGAAITRKADPRTLTKKDRDEISRRVLRGERIEF